MGTPFKHPLTLALAMLLGALGGWLPASSAQARLCPAQLTPRLEALLSQAPLDTAYTGMLLQTQGATAARHTLYARNADRLFTPASNAKLLTTAAALQFLGGSYRMRTSVYGTPGPGGLTALRVVGRGDPSLTEVQLQALAQQLAQAGVTQVSTLTVDDSYFPGFATNPTWEWEDAQADYGAPVNSLILNQNAVAVQVSPTQVGQPLALRWPPAFLATPWPVLNQTVTVATAAEAMPVSLWRPGATATLEATGRLGVDAESITLGLAVLDPAQRFADGLRLALADQSIPVAQVAISPPPGSLLGMAPAALPELAAVESPPLAELLVPTNRDSNNLYAEALLKTLGVTYVEPPQTDASQAGTAAVLAVLADLGVATGSLRLADGSGLSRHNLVTPQALVETLQVMAEQPEAEVFQNSLAVAGTSGTLRNRLRDTPLAGRLQGKSGAITGNVSLSGYVQPPDYPPLVVSIIINHADHPASLLRETIDAMLGLVGQLSADCSA
ncbi:MAG: D-alanyl-D-alanine carboxypeptidase/D-alanyl-D-alanine-endopeptidase [Nodosilinea sp.]